MEINHLITFEKSLRCTRVNNSFELTLSHAERRSGSFHISFQVKTLWFTESELESLTAGLKASGQTVAGYYPSQWSCFQINDGFHPTRSLCLSFPSVVRSQSHAGFPSCSAEMKPCELSDERFPALLFHTSFDYGRAPLVAPICASSDTNITSSFAGVKHVLSILHAADTTPDFWEKTAHFLHWLCCSEQLMAVYCRCLQEGTAERSDHLLDPVTAALGPARPDCSDNYRWQLGCRSECQRVPGPD